MFLRSWRVRAGCVVVVVASAFAVAPSLRAQATGTVAGVVKVEPTGAQLSGVKVGVDNRSASTDASGKFRITGLTGDSVTLTVRRIGFQPTERRVRVGDQNIEIRIRERVVELNSVVVTGTPGAVSKRELGVSVVQINAADIVKTQPVQNVQGLINGRAPGVVVIQNSGVVGSGATVRVRGGSSLSLSNQPLIYVDGVRVDNSQGTGPGNQSFGASTTTRWNDFNPDDIESVEIVRGPAATALYGTEAINGVIQIITKRGAQGKPRWDFISRQGVSQFDNWQNRFPTNYAKVNGVLTSVNVGKIRGDSSIGLFRNGRINNNTLAVSGGSPAVQYRLSGNVDREEGVEPTNGQTQYGFRGNIHVTPGSQIDIVANAGYVRGTTTLSCEAGCGGVMFSGFYANPATLGTVRAGFSSGTPEAYWKQYYFDQLFNRFTGNVTITHTPAPWFSQQLSVGTDFGHEQNNELSAVHHDLSYFFGTDADSGYKNVDYRDNTLSTLTYHGTTTLPITASLKSTTAVGADFYLRNTKYATSSGSDFPAPGLTALSSTTSGKNASGYSRDNNSLGVFAQEEVGWNDRLFLTVGVRSDQNSSFGKNFKNVVYPHYALSWVASDEPYFHVPWVSALKLRAAYGQSGAAPPLFVTEQSYRATPTGVAPQAVGNPNLQPERGYETELGFDAGFLNDRAGLELTYYTGGTRDEILEVQVPPSSGYGGTTRFVNGGRITRHGLELALRATPIQTPSTTWDITLNASTNENKVEYLNGADFLVPSTYIQNRVGFPLYSWFGKRAVSGTVGGGTVTNILCDDGKGGSVACGSAPDVYLGRTIPKVEGSFITSLQFLTNFRIGGMIDFKRGYNKLNGDERVRCQLFRRCLANFDPTVVPIDVAAGYAYGASSPGTVIHDASFARLREISLTWTIPTKFAREIGAGAASITIAGRNLHTWTEYPGLDPEASFQGGSRGGGQWEQAVLPQLRQLVTTLNLTF